MTVILFSVALALYLISTIFYLLFLAFDKRNIQVIGHLLLFAGFLTHLLSTLIRYIQAG